MKKLFKKKIIIPLLLLLIAAGFFGYKALKSNDKETRYVLAAVEKGTIIISVSGTGQISASDQADIKSKVSGDITYLNVQKGQGILANALLAQIDATDAQKAIQDAQTTLQQEKLNLDKMKGMVTDEGTLRGTKEKATEDLNKAYEDGFNNVANIFLDLPSIMAGLQDIIFSYSFTTSQQNIDYYADAVKIYDDKVLQYKTDTYDKYQISRKTYDQNFEDYKSASRFSEKNVTESLISETYETVKDIAETVKSTNNLIQFYQDKLIAAGGLKPQTLSSTHLSSLNTYTGKTNTYLLNLLSTKNTIQSDKEAIIEADFSIKDQEIKVAQAEETLSEAQEKLADYSVYTPFGGIISDVNVKKGDSVSAGTVLAVVITWQKIAEISLNEVDAAKVKAGQKATLTFDALSDVSISGKVLEMDTAGTVSQGVVSYGVKIVLDTQDERIKPGMSVAADIITDVKQDVLVLPNNAIKSQGNSRYVELAEVPAEMKQQSLTSVSGVILSNSPKQQSVEIGLSNDLSTEIVSGLKEGDIVVTSTISSNKVQTTQTQTNQSRGTQEFRIPGL